ncbi:MAG TPA: hypothetical protein VHE61_05145 [Opitutaceae bacterium]|nr:hypothetical protein [Opitutaceae bacterium]
MSEPVEHCRELDEAEKRRGEFVVAGADAPAAFDPTEEVFDAMAKAIVAAVEGNEGATSALQRDANPGPLPEQTRTKRIRIEGFVGDDTVPAQARQQRIHRIQVMPLTSCESQRHGASVAVHKPRVRMRPLGHSKNGF